jgi:WD40 repeat protein
MYEQEMTHSITVLQGISPTWISCLASMTTGPHRAFTQHISPNGTRLAVGYYNHAVLWDTRTTVMQWDLHMPQKYCLAFSPSESILAVASEADLTLRNATTGAVRITHRLSGGDVHAAAFSSEGQYLLLSIDQSLHLYHGTDASELSVLPMEWHHASIVFTSDNAQVITGSKEGQIHLILQFIQQRVERNTGEKDVQSSWSFKIGSTPRWPKVGIKWRGRGHPYL